MIIDFRAQPLVAVKWGEEDFYARSAKWTGQGIEWLMRSAILEGMVALKKNTVTVGMNPKQWDELMCCLDARRAVDFRFDVIGDQAFLHLCVGGRVHRVCSDGLEYDTVRIT